MAILLALVALISSPQPAGKRLDAGVTWTRITRPGPVRINLLTVSDPRRVRVLTGGDRVPGLERPSAMARRHGALAGINGGFFAVHSPDLGDPTGIVADRGTLLSEPVGARTGLVIPRTGRPRIAALRWRGRITAGGATRLVDGVDRNRGRIPACGGVGGDEPTERIDTAITCTDASELVVLTPQFGASTRTAAGGVEAVVRDGAVTSVRRAADTAIPGDGYVLSGSGDAAAFLRRLHPGDRPRLDLGVGDDLAVLGGAPRLVRHGRVHVTAAAEGRGADTAAAPRTVAGIRADGALLLITIDGRRPGWSRGATLPQAARIARSLGAVDAVNLDSGGSTTMNVRGRVVNRPSDPGGERAVADGLFVLTPARRRRAP